LQAVALSRDAGRSGAPAEPAPGRIFRHPEPVVAATRVWPVYLTFQGCPGRCVFCAQPLQSGRPAAPPDRILAAMRADLDAAGKAGRGPYELAFYGGVFTALPSPWPERFLEAAGRARADGLISRIRCSTRPDACEPALLDRLRAAGLDLVEIGAQTFADPVLTAVGRGHDAAAIRRAARNIRHVGLRLGVQLLPGLPGHTPADLVDDASETVALAPEIVRLYPCLVLPGTPLAQWYRSGRYTPWSLPGTIDALAGVLPVLWRAGIRVARIGLAPEPAMVRALVAGPWHPALGCRVRARATFSLVAAEVRAMGGRAAALIAPRRFSGELFGHAGELVPAYAALGLARSAIRFESREDFRLVAGPV